MRLGDLGDADFSLGGFSLWIHGWERDSAEFWDNNWLDITARFKSGGQMGSATLLVSGTILHSVDLEQAALSFAQITDTLQGVAEFCTMEPGFDIKLEALTAGRVRFTLEMVPGADELYEFSAEIDQSYLPAAMAALKNIVKTYGPRGERPPVAPDPT
jgi:hypothetical protein